MSSEQERMELEARVFSRAGADDPRTEHVDPATLRVLLMTDSEWRLLEFDRFSAGVGAARRVRAVGSAAPARRTDPPTGGGADAHDGPFGGPGPGADPLHGPARQEPPRRHRSTLLALVAAVGAIVSALVVGALGAPALLSPARSDASGDAVVDLTIVPRAPAAAGAIAGPPAADPHHHDVGTMAVFLDPDRTRGSLPGWLEDAIPSSHVAQLASPAGPITGVGIYAVSTPDFIACLIARIEAAEMIWSCAPVRELAADGMVLRAAIPEGLASGLDTDADGISGDASHTDLLIVEWHADGTFRIAREPD